VRKFLVDGCGRSFFGTLSRVFVYQRSGKAGRPLVAEKRPQVFIDSKLGIMGAAALIKLIVFYYQIKQLIDQDALDIGRILILLSCLRHLLAQDLQGLCSVRRAGRHPHRLTLDVIVNEPRGGLLLASVRISVRSLE
jgi:hypothetical protein